LQVAVEEIEPVHTELLEAAEFAELRSDSGKKLLIQFWRNACQHKDMRDVKGSQLAQVRSTQVQGVQGQGTIHFTSFI
jgi:hypothetical protein